MKEEQELLEIQILTPLTAKYFQKWPHWQEEDDGFDLDEEGELLSGADLAQYEAEISKWVDKENQYGEKEGQPCNLMDYYDGNQAVKEKVASAVVSVKNVNGVLYGRTTLKVKEFLEREEMDELCSYITGQYSDGWGEGFEQRDIDVGDGYLNVHFYQHHDFHFQEVTGSEKALPEENASVPVKKKPKLDLVGHDGNIFSILGRAQRLLKRNGQENEAREMGKRVFGCDSYPSALEIISEYVDTELSTHQRKSRSPEREKHEKGESR